MQLKSSKTINLIASIMFIFFGMALFFQIFIVQNFNHRGYVPHFDSIPISVEASVRAGKDCEKEPFYLDIKVTNHGKKAIASINYCVDYYYYYRDFNAPSSYIGPLALTKPLNSMWNGLTVIGSGNTKTFSIPIELPRDADKIECDLYITWINYAWHRDQWGSEGLHDLSFIAENAPKINVSGYIAV